MIGYTARETSDFVEAAQLNSAVNAGLIRARLQDDGVAAAEAAQLLKPVRLNTVALQAGADER